MKDGLLILKHQIILQTTYDLQGAVYAQCYEENFGLKIDRVGVLWLKSRSRGEDKTGKRLKGKGWEISRIPQNTRRKPRYIQISQENI